MASSLSIELRGVDGLKAKLLNLVPKVRTGTQQTVAEVALLIESDAKLLSPVDTGRNRASIHTDIAPNGLSAQVAAGTEYAVHLEFGTRYMRARPFLFPAFEKNRAAFLAALKRNLKLI